MSIYSKSSGWQLTPEARVKVNGSWQTASFGYVKVNGKWEIFHTASGSNVTNFRFTQILNDSVTFAWDAGEDVVSYQLWYSKKSNTQEFFSNAIRHSADVTSTYTNQTGKITLSTGSKEINGIGTSFTSLSVGNNLYVTENSVRIYLGKIVSIASNTKLTVTKTWSGSTYNAPGINFISQNNGSISFNTERESNYQFYVLPIGEGSVAGNRSPILTRSTPVAVPSPDTISGEVVSNGVLQLRWAPNPRASFYELWSDKGRAVGDYVNVARIERSGGAQEFYQAPADNDNEAVYRVVIKSVNALNEKSSNSNSYSFTFIKAPPELVATTLSATASGTVSANLSWGANPGASSYNLFVDGVNVKSISKSGLATEKYTHIGAKEDTSYVIKIEHVGQPKYVPSKIFSNSVTLKTGHAAVYERTTSDLTKRASYVNGQYQYYTEWDISTRSAIRNRRGVIIGYTAWSAYRDLRTDGPYTITTLPAEFPTLTGSYTNVAYNASTATARYRYRFINFNFSRNFDFNLGLTQTEEDDGVTRKFVSFTTVNLARTGWQSVSTSRYGTKLSTYGVNVSGGGYRGANEFVNGASRRVDVKYEEKKTEKTKSELKASIA
jgi:hypothetical protein